MKTRTNHSKRLLVASMLAVAFAVISAAPASAERDYRDEDSEVLSVAATILRPVGILLDTIIFKPLHAFSHWSDPNDGLSKRPVRSCRSLRPRRDCSSE